MLPGVPLGGAVRGRRRPGRLVTPPGGVATVDHSIWRDAADGWGPERLILGGHHRHGCRARGGCRQPALAFLARAEILPAVPEGAAPLGLLGLDRGLDLPALRLSGRALDKPGATALRGRRHSPFVPSRAVRAQMVRAGGDIKCPAVVSPSRRVCHVPSQRGTAKARVPRRGRHRKHADKGPRRGA